LLRSAARRSAATMSKPAPQSAWVPRARSLGFLSFLSSP